MKAQQHTPGPWHCIGDSIGTESCEIATVWNPTDSLNLYCEKRANARLIAAAPDLLAVCLELEESSAYWSEYDVPLGIFDRIQAVIAKATGEKL